MIPGPIAEKITRALMDAFPKNRLEDFIFFEFQQRLENVALGGDYTEVVRKVVQWADAAGHARELVHEARVRNPDHAGLKAVARELRGPTSAELMYALVAGLQLQRGETEVLLLLHLDRFRDRVALIAASQSFGDAMTLMQEIAAALQPRSAQMAALFRLGFDLESFRSVGNQLPDVVWRDLELQWTKSDLEPAIGRALLARMRSTMYEDAGAVVAGILSAPLPFSRDGAPSERTAALPRVPRLDGPAIERAVVAGPTAVFFSASWADHSIDMEPVIEGLASEFEGGVQFAEIDVDQQPELAAYYRVDRLPTLLVFRGGREVDRIVGDVARAAVAARLQTPA